METLKALAEATGLNGSFFWQLAGLAGGYFAAKALFLKPFAMERERGKSMTHGRLSQSREREKEARRLEALYGERARALHKKFQDLFGREKAAAEEEHKKERARLLKQHEADFKAKRAGLAQKLQEEGRGLEKDIPLLARALKDKISGSRGEGGQ